MVKKMGTISGPGYRLAGQEPQHNAFYKLAFQYLFASLAFQRAYIPGALSAIRSMIQTINVRPSKMVHLNLYHDRFPNRDIELYAGPRHPCKVMQGSGDQHHGIVIIMDHGMENQVLRFAP